MPKNIIICCDGTANEYSRNNTNVVKLYEMVELSETQVTFYDPGVGTSSRSLFVPFRWLSNTLSQALGLDLNKNVEEAYWYLMNNYEEGDRIFLFGFSRGAHTVRRLACVLEKCGLLYRGSDNMIPYVVRMYNKDEDPEVIGNFRKTYTRPCPVHFLGVWDTVSAVSKLLFASRLDGKISKGVKHIYHAVSIDEKRLTFGPNLIDQKNIDKNQTAEEVWFAGVHSDVGGFYRESGLSDIALKWMFEKAIAAGIEYSPDLFAKINPNPKDKIHESWAGLFWFVPWHIYIGAVVLFIFLLKPFDDTVAYFYKNWWLSPTILVLPIFFTKKARKIPNGAKIHSSVQKRINDFQCNYKPTNLTSLIDEKKVTWVD